MTRKGVKGMKQKQSRQSKIIQKRQSRHQEIEKAIKKIVPILGLENWSITVSYYHRQGSTLFPKTGSLASTFIDLTYHRISMAILDTKKIDSYSVPRIVLHELLHVVVSPLSQSINMIPNTTNDQVQQINNSEETVVEQLAFLLSPFLDIPSNVDNPNQDSHIISFPIKLPSKKTEKGGEDNE